MEGDQAFGLTEGGHFPPLPFVQSVGQDGADQSLEKTRDDLLNKLRSDATLAGFLLNMEHTICPYSMFSFRGAPLSIHFRDSNLISIDSLSGSFRELAGEQMFLGR